MKRVMFSAVVLLALAAAGGAQDATLTVDQAKKLLPAAAGISNADLEALMKNPRPEAVKNKSLSLAILTLRPQGNPSADMEKEFRFLGDKINVSDVARAMSLSRGDGYASFLQPEYITECTVASNGGRAEGVVTFKSDVFAGQIPFAAQATKDGWVVTEFRMPQYKIKVVRGADGVWSQEALKGK